MGSYSTLNIERDGRRAIVTIDNPPINLITQELYGDLVRASIELRDDPDLSVAVFRSANPDFFMAHFDVELILTFPVEGDAEKSRETNAFHALCERLRSMDKVTIAEIGGRVGGGGSELSASMDMRFGVLGKTKINQMEVPIGILPGGTGTQRLPRLMGRGRAMEVILGGEDLDAATAERWGYLNRAFEDEAAMRAHVDRLSGRIRDFPVEAVRLAKQSVDGFEAPLNEGLQEEGYLFQRLLRTDSAPRAMRRFLDLGGQTHEGEMRVGDLNGEVADD